MVGIDIGRSESCQMNEAQHNSLIVKNNSSKSAGILPDSAKRIVGDSLPVHHHLLEHTLLSDLLLPLNTFFNQSDISFSEFKKCWILSNSSCLHFCCPLKADYQGYIQIAFGLLLNLFHQPPYIGGSVSTNPEGISTNGGVMVFEEIFMQFSFSHLFKIDNTSHRGVFWNIGVLFALYCLHGTQPGAPNTGDTRKSHASHSLRHDIEHQLKTSHPIRVSPDTFLSFALAVHQILSLLPEEVGSQVHGVFQKMLQQNAFLYAMHTGPKGLFFIERYLKCELLSLTSSARPDGHEAGKKNAQEGFIRLSTEAVAQLHEYLLKDKEGTQAECRVLFAAHFKCYHFPSAATATAANVESQATQTTQSGSARIILADAVDDNGCESLSARQRNEAYSEAKMKRKAKSAPTSKTAKKAKIVPQSEVIPESTPAAIEDSVNPIVPVGSSSSGKSIHRDRSNPSTIAKKNLTSWEDEEEALGAEQLAADAGMLDDFLFAPTPKDNNHSSTQRASQVRAEEELDSDLISTLAFLETATQQILRKKK